MAGQPQPRPEVTLVASSAPVRATVDVPPPARVPRTAVLVGLTLVVLVAVQAARSAQPAPAGPRPDAALVLVPDGITVSLGGVLVVPFELDNPGPALEVRDARLWAEPVREDPVLRAPSSVVEGGSRSFVAVLAPDCRLLRGGSPIRFSATVVLRVGVGSAEQELVSDVGADPAVRARVSGLCG